MEEIIKKSKIRKIVIIIFIIGIICVLGKIIIDNINNENINSQEKTSQKQQLQEQNLKQKVIENIPELWEEANVNENDWYNYDGKNVNEPKLKGNMIAIKFSEDVEGNKWANAITSDGSMWVWIPRFAYKITERYHGNVEGKIEIAFLDMENNFLNDEDYGKIEENPKRITYTEGIQDQWLIHPAFTSNAANGGGFGEKNGISGIWVAKFEASGNANKDGTIEKIEIKPGAISLRCIKINNIYKAALNTKYGENEDLKSHMIKNSEWGAIVYLAHSKYGINTEKIQQNTSQKYYTGGTNIKSEIYKGENRKQSSTYNAYGVYDLNGGTYEIVASYVDNNNETLKENGGESAGDIYGETMEERQTSTEYKTVYPTTTQNNAGNQNADYKLTELIKGDAIYETSCVYLNYNGAWFGSYANYPFLGNPFFIHGGNYILEYSNAFCFSSSDGSRSKDIGFRTALVT